MTPFYISPDVRIRSAIKKDVSTILFFVRELARYEKLEHEVVSTEENLKETLFGSHPYAEVLFLELNENPVGFALFFHSYSTFLGQPGIYLEDLFVLPEERGKGFGKMLLTFLAKLAVDRKCGRLEWSVLDWNEPAIQFYKSLGSKDMNEWTVHRLTGAALTKVAQSLGDLK